MTINCKKILICQTAFLGDVILATVLVEALRHRFPHATIDFLVRKNNEQVLDRHPFLRRVFIWDKIVHKWRNYGRLLLDIRRQEYDLLVNVQRHFSTGLLTIFSGAKVSCGYSANPLSWFFSFRADHSLQNKFHEVTRCLDLIKPLWDSTFSALYKFKPTLYPLPAELLKKFPKPYITITPTSARQTKQLPKSKWIELIHRVPQHIAVYISGAPGEQVECQEIADLAGNSRVQVLTHEYSILQKASIFKQSLLNYVLDPAATHLCSSVDAPVCTVYCSTSEEFGFGPLSSCSAVVSVKNLSCRPCTTHGRQGCPLGHFKCGFDIDVNQLFAVLEKRLEASHAQVDG